MGHYLDRTICEFLAEKIAQRANLVRSIESSTDQSSIDYRNGWLDRVDREISECCETYLPRGSGFDSGTTLDVDASRPNRLIFNTSFHHMDEGGCYDGWSEHNVIVTPTLTRPGFDLRVTGRDRNGIKDYIGEVMNEALAIVLTRADQCALANVDDDSARFGIPEAMPVSGGGERQATAGKEQRPLNGPSTAPHSVELFLRMF